MNLTIIHIPSYQLRRLPTGRLYTGFYKVNNLVEKKEKEKKKKILDAVWSEY
jgi:hypothetical protein